MKDFKDINFKFGILACLNDLGFYTAEAEKIKRIKSYSREYREAAYSDIVQEVYDYYKELDIPQELLDKIVVFCPGLTCYNLMVKEWDGEDDIFDIQNLDGIEHLTNLKEYRSDMLSRENPDISALLRCEKLEKVSLEYIPLTDAIEGVIEQLKEKGGSFYLKYQNF